jgi:DNA-binding IclR family transcriptional regulator
MPIAPSPAVLRAGDLLEFLQKRPTEACSVSELARAVGIPRATCDAILQALAVHRLVTRREEGRRQYVLGPANIGLGEAARRANPMLPAARVAAEQLAHAMRTCVAVSIRDGDMIRVAEVFDFAPMLALRVRVGQAIALVPPFGAVFVAWDEDAEQWIAAADTEEDRNRYRLALAEVRRRGYSVGGSASRTPELEMIERLAEASDAASGFYDRSLQLDELTLSRYLETDVDDAATVRVGQISAPVFGPDERVTASLLVPGPDRRVTGAELHALAERITAAAREATRSAGGRAPDPPPR